MREEESEGGGERGRRRVREEEREGGGERGTLQTVLFTKRNDCRTLNNYLFVAL